jgi:hypothetical protein
MIIDDSECTNCICAQFGLKFPTSEAELASFLSTYEALPKYPYPPKHYTGQIIF